eukprot:CAMPEP_0196734520 /NCGR_PEP_ID=MMETSP1091-20130531/13235_1 /TAXON_ID=302021 /ORGANISM="Rhodomonas sp., Strain CCMP768" /LENGTH=159 /DNA_ID=CAMNT_0042078039 /DNA_START=16 /DNA_END=490 /DNA_ORIENTATION=+
MSTSLLSFSMLSVGSRRAGRALIGRTMALQPLEKLDEMELQWKEGKSVYRQLLRAASRYPSRKKDMIYEDIRQDFRDHKSVTDKTKLYRYRSQAVSGLAGMLQLVETQADQDKDWEIGPVDHPHFLDPNEKGDQEIAPDRSLNVQVSKAWACLTQHGCA